MADDGGTPSDPASSVSLQRIQSLLKAKDDTSRFVGLALLKAFLDYGGTSQGPEVLQDLWRSISPKFLDSLLHARHNERIGQVEAQNMVNLAVAVLHTFTTLLPEESRKDSKLTRRTAPLVDALVQSTDENLILQTLVSIVSQQEGAMEFLKIQDFTSLIDIATTHPLAIKIFNFSWVNASSVPSQTLVVREHIDNVLPMLLLAFAKTDAVTLITSIGDLLPSLNPQSISPEPKWLPDLALAVRRLVISKPTLAGRAAYTKLASVLFQVFPITAPILLFRDGVSGSTESKPFSYLFVNLLLIDLRSSFPSLLSKIDDAEYTVISQRLSAAFDVLSGFVGFLIRALEEETFNPGFSMPPDLLLKLRKDISETISLTIEYLRDRWDASFAGVSGLHKIARSGAAVTSEGTRLTLTWDTMKDVVTADPVVLAGIRGIAIWIREDENENLRTEAAGLMDMLLELYKQGTEIPQFRYPILLALEGIMVADNGVETFLGQDGWNILSQDLQSIFRFICTSTTDTTHMSESQRATQIIRVLLSVLDHPMTTTPEEAWIEGVRLTASLNIPSNTLSAAVLEAFIASLQLSTALLSKAAGGMTKRYITSQPALRSLAKQLKSVAANLEDGAEAEDLMGLLDEVLMDLQNIG